MQKFPIKVLFLLLLCLTYDKGTHMISNSRDRVWLRVNRILKLASVQRELRLSGFELEGGLQSAMMSSEVASESSQPASAADTLAGLDKTSC